MASATFQWLKTVGLHVRCVYVGVCLRLANSQTHKHIHSFQDRSRSSKSFDVLIMGENDADGARVCEIAQMKVLPYKVESAI